MLTTGLETRFYVYILLSQSDTTHREMEGNVSLIPRI